MRALAAGLLLLLAAGCASEPPRETQAPSFESLLAASAGALERGEAPSAVLAGSKAIERAPLDARGWAARALARDALGDNKGARVDANRALELTGDEPAAIEALIAIERLYGASARITERRARLRLKAGQIDAAIDDLTRTIAAGAGWGDLLILRGDALLKRGDWNGAVADYARATEVSPHSARVWTVWAGVKRKMGQDDDALVALTKALALDPRNVPAVSERAAIELEHGQLALAERDFTAAILLAPNALMTWVYRGDVRHRREDYAGAEADFTKALKMDPSLVSIWCRRAQARLAQGDLVGAEDDARRALEIDPQSEWASSILDGIAREKK
jgi:tetratricopeptide (TPR) repeat protein